MVSYSIKFGLASLSVLLLLILNPAITAAQPQYGFVYFYVADYGKTVEVVKLTTGSSQAVKATYPMPIGWHLSTPQLQGLSSPQGTWIASFLFVEDHTNRLMVHLYNPLTQEAREIIDGYTTSHGELLAWSPDGLRLAMIFGTVNDSNVDLYVYSVADDRLTNITHDKFEQRDISWSTDSKQIATFTVPCELNEVCTNQLEVYDTATKTRINYVSLLSLPASGYSACSPHFSPTFTYISFISNCGYLGFSAYDFAREVIIWDIKQAELNQITDFFNAAGAKPFFAAAYSHLWLDDDTLVVGVDYQMQEPPRVHQLFTYQVSTKTVEVLSTNLGAGFVVDNAATRIALGRYVVLGTVDPATIPINTSVAFLRLEKTTFTKGNFETEVARNNSSLPYGCFYQWSPNSSMLAFTVDETGNCFVNVSHILITNTSGEVLQETTVPSINSPESFIMPVGWVQISQ